VSRSLSPNDYFVDLLFRTEHPIPDSKDAIVRAEAVEILTYALTTKLYRQRIELIGGAGGR
jgi:hypothetical protein